MTIRFKIDEKELLLFARYKYLYERYKAAAMYLEGKNSREPNGELINEYISKSLINYYLMLELFEQIKKKYNMCTFMSSEMFSIDVNASELYIED